MNRRNFIKSGAVAGTTLLAGCSKIRDNLPGDNNGSNEETETDGNTTDSTETPQTSYTITNQNFQVTGSACRSENANNIELVQYEGNTFEVKGSYNTPDPCYTLELLDMKKESGNTLNPEIGARREETEGTCQQCLGKVDFKLTVEFKDTLPEKVHVELLGATSKMFTRSN